MLVFQYTTSDNVSLNVPLKLLLTDTPVLNVQIIRSGTELIVSADAVPVKFGLITTVTVQTIMNGMDMLVLYVQVVKYGILKLELVHVQSV